MLVPFVPFHAASLPDVTAAPGPVTVFAIAADSAIHAGISPDTIGYIEAHGTGTPLGDPIEIAALTQAFRTGTQRQQFCALGSVKSNVGHLSSAAGISGLIKGILTVQHGQIPPSLHFENPSTHIDMVGLKLRVPTTMVPSLATAIAVGSKSGARPKVSLGAVQVSMVYPAGASA